MQSTTTPAQFTSPSDMDSAPARRHHGPNGQSTPQIFGRLACFFALASLLTTTACDESDAKAEKLFDEDGVWSLKILDFGRGGGRQVLGDLAKDAFLLKFDPGEFKVAAASCAQSDDGHFEPLKTKCRFEKSDKSRDWTCHCFDYNVGERQMMWKMYKSNDEDDLLARHRGDEDGSDSDETGSDAVDVIEGPDLDPEDEDVTVVKLQETGKQEVKIFGPLPGPATDDVDGVFGSDGVNSSYEMARRASGVFDESGCAKFCGID